jgi:cell division protein FtsW
MNWLISRTKGDFVIWMVVFMLSLFGLLAVYSSTGTLAYRFQQGNTEYYLFKHLTLLALGIGFMYLAHLVDYRYWSRISQLLVVIAFPLLAYTLFFGDSVNGAVRWVTLPIINQSFQTSDLAKFGLIMYLARVMSKRQDDIKDFRKTFMPLLTTITGICLLIAPANLSTALVLFATCLIIMFIGRVNMKYLLLLIVSGVVGLGILVAILFTVPDDSLKKLGRFKTWKSRIESHWSGDDGGSYQSQQAKIAIASGGIFGKGPGQSTQRNFLPEPYSDFIFAIIIEEYGLIGASFLLFLYLLFLFRTIRIVIKSPRAFGALLAFGLSLSMVIQAFINMGVAVNIFPVTGLPLPLVSMGGTSLWFNSLAFGIILSVSRNIEEESQSEEAVLKPVAI